MRYNVITIKIKLFKDMRFKDGRFTYKLKYWVEPPLVNLFIYLVTSKVRGAKPKWHLEPFSFPF